MADTNFTGVELLDGSTYHIPTEVADELTGLRNVALDAMDILDGESNSGVLTDPDRVENATETDSEDEDDEHEDSEDYNEDEEPPAKAKKDRGWHRRGRDSRSDSLRAERDFYRAEATRMDALLSDPRPGAERANLICDAADMLGCDRNDLAEASELEIKAAVLDSRNIQTEGQTQAYIDAAYDICCNQEFGDGRDEMSRAAGRHLNGSYRRDNLGMNIPSDLQNAFSKSYAQGLGPGLSRLNARRANAWKSKYTDWMKGDMEDEEEHKKKNGA